MIDSIQVWTKTKEAFGWPEDTEEYLLPMLPMLLLPTIMINDVVSLSLTPVDKVDWRLVTQLWLSVTSPR
jgi:hypothetical protein